MFRRIEVKCAWNRSFQVKNFRPILRLKLGKAKVDDLQNATDEEEVLWLDVKMHDAIVVNLLQSLEKYEEGSKFIPGFIKRHF